MMSRPGNPPSSLHGNHSPSQQQPPPLPPRSESNIIQAVADDTEVLNRHHAESSPMVSRDPRSSSTQSLVPGPESERHGKRTLLLVYIHGFMGDETSFQSFPAHVHNLVTVTLADTHLVHTKIYPKYRSRHHIEVARDAFSQWLAPHESPTTDVILLGHSMGGLLAADVTLKPSGSSVEENFFCHRIIGTINFDTPFLGMHPGVVKSGLSSIFRSNDDPKPQTRSDLNNSTNIDNNGNRPSRMNTLFSPKPSDPNYNPEFDNDIHLPVRKTWESVVHFVSKHSDGLMKATKNYLTSHIEFGGAMADYGALKNRYARIRALEEDDENSRRVIFPGPCVPSRVRFINYYTASTGRPKKSKSPSSSRPPSRGSSTRSREAKSERHSESLAPTSTIDSHLNHSRSPSKSPRISLEEHRGHEIIRKTPEEPLSATSPIIEDDVGGGFDQSSDLEPQPLQITSETDSVTQQDFGLSREKLPSIPDIPEEPPNVDFTQYTDKETRKRAEKEHARTLKEYKKAVKHRNTAIKERQRLEQKSKNKAEKESQRQNKSSGQKKAKESEYPVANDAIETKDFSWEEVWAADRAREAKQREFETLSRQIGNKQAEETIKDTSSEGKSDRTNSPTPFTSNYTHSNSAILNAESPEARIAAADKTDSLSPVSSHTEPDDHTSSPAKPKRYKKFCMLPPKDARGHKDPTWFRVFMEGVDEVGAHCGLFFMSDTYERLVGEVGGRIEEWVREDMSTRYVRELSGQH